VTLLIIISRKYNRKPQENRHTCSNNITWLSADGTNTGFSTESTFHWNTYNQQVNIWDNSYHYYKWKVAGLGSDPTQAFLTTSGVTAWTACTNKGGNNPPGQEAQFGPTQGQIVNITSRNSQITFHNATPLSITITAEQAGCPDNMTPSITSATFSDVVLHIVQNGQEVLTHNFGTVDP